MRFTLRQLQVFVAACELESVTLAANREHLSQSAASSAIAQLERAVDLQLLLRHHAHGVTPTPAGRVFLEHARAVLREATMLNRATDDMSEAVTGTLHLGCLVTLAPIVLPRFCKGYRDRFPDVTFQIEEAGQERLLRQLHDGAISLAITYDLGLEAEFEFCELASLPPFALFADGHTGVGNGAVSIEDLASQPMVLLDLPLSREYFYGLFAAKGLEPNVQHRSPHPDVVRSMVANGFGYTLVNARPAIDRAMDGSRVVTKPLSGEHRPMQLGIASLAGVREPRLVCEFRSHCRDVASASGVPGLSTY